MVRRDFAASTSTDPEVEWPERTAVTHPKFGPGIVSSVKGRGPDAKLTISFDSGEMRTLLARFVRAHQD
jgi:hypothetical protein